MAKPARNTTFQGAQLRRARREKKLSQAELADLLGIHRTSLVRWESDVADPSLQQEEAIARILERPRWWFHQGDVDPMSPTWITDPWLRMTPLPRLQRLTQGALKSLAVGATKLAEVTHMTVPRLEALLDGSPPTAQEIQWLREKLGEDFNPTPTLSRKASSTPSWSVSEATESLGSAPEMSLEEKIDLVLARLARLEKRQVHWEEMLQEYFSRKA
jgi:transcriptional regulator with XRE-family HTH domain